MGIQYHVTAMNYVKPRGTERIERKEYVPLDNVSLVVMRILKEHKPDRININKVVI